MNALDSFMEMCFYISTLSAPIMFVISTPCLVIHVYKFLRSAGPQSLASKNLTLYCFYLIISNTVNTFMILPPFLFISSILSPKEHEEVFKNLTLLNLTWEMKFCLYYFHLVTAILKSLIALDICLCFRKIAVYLQRPSGPQTGKFLIYCVLATITPLPYVIFRTYEYANDIQEPYKQFTILANIRILRLIPVIAAFWYLRSASINKKELWTKFSLHMRLLIMIGGLSSVVSIAEISIRIATGLNGWTDGILALTSEFMNVFGATLEGILIGIFFTFRKDTFKPVATGNSVLSGRTE